MDKFVTNTKRLIFSKQKDIFSSVLILSSMIIVSKLFGFLRYRTLAVYFTTEELDIFFASFRIPDLIFEVLVTGAFTASFIPIFIKYQKSKEELNTNISSIINFIFLFLTASIVLIFIFLGKITTFITPGFSPDKIQQIIYFSQLLLIGQLPFLILGNFLTGIGQASKIFFLSAIAPIFYNVAIILSTILLYNNFYLLSPIIGVIIGSVLFFIIQVPALALSEYRFHIVFKKTKGLIEFFHMIIPRTFTVIASQIDATIDLTLATLVGAGSYTIFYLAQRLQMLPVSILGMAFGQAALPYLTEIYQEKRIDELKQIIMQSMLNLLFFTVPIASFFIFARTPIVRLFFGGQKFDWDATVATAVTLSYFSMSLPFHSIYYFLIRAFYAIMDTKIPFIVSLFSITINATLSLYFILVLKLPVWSMAISFSAAMVVNVVILFIILSYRLKNIGLYHFLLEGVRITFATVISSIITYYLMKLLAIFVFDLTRTINVFFLLLISALVFFLLYLFLAWLLNVREIYLIAKLLMKANEYKKKVLEIYNPIEK